MSRPISSESKFRAIAHPTRRGIIDLLVRDEQTPNEMASHFKHSRPVFSKHLRVLEVAGLVSHERQKTQLVYRIVPGAFESLQQWISKLPRASGR